jgi:nucleotide-binding universal stress UspA family protein
MNPKQLNRSSRNDAAGVDDRKVLIVALDAAAPAEAPDGEVLVVAPALNSRLRHWLSDDDTARRRAGERLTGFIELLERRGVHAGGRVGDADPLLAIADALVTFPADEIVIAAGPHHSTRFAEQLATRARKPGVPAVVEVGPMPGSTGDTNPDNVFHLNHNIAP